MMSKMLDTVSQAINNSYDLAIEHTLIILINKKPIPDERGYLDREELAQNSILDECIEKIKELKTNKQ